MSENLTKGEYRVGIDFNPSGNEVVTNLKRLAAAFIDAVDAIEPPQGTNGSEVGRLKALAQTSAEEAAMWAVKAATKKG